MLYSRLFCPSGSAVVCQDVDVLVNNPETGAWPGGAAGVEGAGDPQRQYLLSELHGAD